MNIFYSTKYHNDHYSIITDHLQKKMLNSLCGLVQRISYMNRGANDASFMTAGGELTGVHILRNQKNPGSNAYHIGGGGFLQDEPQIRVLAESAERYAQLTSAVYLQSKIEFRSYADGESLSLHQLPKDSFNLFTEEQYKTEGFPFTTFSENAPMGWLKMQSLTGNGFHYIPVQFTLVGYVPKVSEGENWMFSAVSTGTAAHTSYTRALRSGILELIQIDAAMGHWYSSAWAPKIIFDQRTKNIKTIIDKRFRATHSTPSFYYLKSADLPGFTIACLIKDQNNLPAASVGLGCDLSLESAMYKALLEAVSVVQLAKLNLLYLPKEHKKTLASGKDIEYMNFDSNVIKYAFPIHAQYLDKKFRSEGVSASELPADLTKTNQADLGYLIECFKGNRFELYGLNLTTSEIRDLKLKVVRTWSPDTLALCLPTFPQKCHVRFTKYGGCSNAYPHPYA